MHNAIVVAAERNHFNAAQLLVDAKGGLEAYVEEHSYEITREFGEGERKIEFASGDASVWVSTLEAGLQAALVKDSVLGHAANGRYLDMAEQIDSVPDGYWGSLSRFIRFNKMGEDFSAAIPNDAGILTTVDYKTLTSSYNYARAAREFSAAGIFFTPEQVGQMEAAIPEGLNGIWPNVIDGREFSVITKSMRRKGMIQNSRDPLDSEGNLTPDTTPQQIVDAVLERFNK